MDSEHACIVTQQLTHQERRNKSDFSCRDHTQGGACHVPARPGVSANLDSPEAKEESAWKNLVIMGQSDSQQAEKRIDIQFFKYISMLGSW